MLRRVVFLTAALAAFAAAGTAPALADDTHHVCVDVGVCTGNIIDVHDVTTTLRGIIIDLL